MLLTLLLFIALVDPKYSQKHEQNHQPKMGAGTVVTTNQNQRYATNSVTGFFVREICRRNKVAYDEVGTGDASATSTTKEVSIPFQEFAVAMIWALVAPLAQF